MSPARAGSFNANFSPETLESFKSLCRDQSRQYTKVLERLAELYLGSQGGILENPEDAILDQGSKLQFEQIASLSQAVKQLETVASMHREDNNELSEQIKDIDKRLKILEKFILERLPNSLFINLDFTTYLLFLAFISIVSTCNVNPSACRSCFINWPN